MSGNITYGQQLSNKIQTYIYHLKVSPKVLTNVKTDFSDVCISIHLNLIHTGNSDVLLEVLISQCASISGAQLFLLARMSVKPPW